MNSDKIDIWVYAHWIGMPKEKCIGILSAHHAKGRKTFSFTYDPHWINSQEQLLLDPDIGWYSGLQFPNSKENFGIFLDSMPDRWGRTLMKRRASQLAKETSKPTPSLYDIDFLLGVQDKSRMGALRFKLDPEGPFLNNENSYPIPPISSIRELQFAISIIESDENNEEIRKWLAILLAPGSSLGGARPKANVYDGNQNLWIAKFPSKNDEIDKGVWEYLTYQLALKAGINMANSALQKVKGKHHTFLTQRFDRKQLERIHFASAMTMTGNNEETLKENTASYLDIAEFIQFAGHNVKEDLAQLWRRILFNIAVSNTDDHLRNHGFLLSPSGWRLSPAYDINPMPDKNGLSLNIDMDNNALEIDLVMSVGEYFQLSLSEMTDIIKEVKLAVSEWKEVAKSFKIPRQEIEIMAPAFRKVY